MISDGAMTNRKLWTELGVNGQKGKVKNNFDHLIKNVRNRLYNKKSLRVVILKLNKLNMSNQ